MWVEGAGRMKNGDEYGGLTVCALGYSMWLTPRTSMAETVVWSRPPEPGVIVRVRTESVWRRGVECWAADAEKYPCRGLVAYRACCMLQSW